MRVLIINTSERTGGAAVAASRLNEALKNNGIKSKMLVRDKQTDTLNVVGIDHSWLNLWRFLWERIVIWAANGFKRDNIFAMDIANTGIDITSLPEFTQADVIHLHWINQGMLSIANLRKILHSGKPIVWTMHDMWPATGICHYSQDCSNYCTECHDCHFLNGGGGKHDISNRVFRKKQKLYSDVRIQFVTCSEWLARKVGSSALLRGQAITHIPNAINTQLFRPFSKEEARLKARLPKEGKFILFGAFKSTDKRKGVDYFIESCNILAKAHPELKDEIGIVVFGKESSALTSLLPFKVYPLDYVSNEHDMVSIYNAVDLLAIPSLEDNLPNTIMEAMACGTPCVGFQTGGIPEMIDHLHNGYVAEYKSSEDFANGMYWTLQESEYASLAEQARRKVVTTYSESTVARHYIEVYNKVTGKNA
jgi:glycosyltransferase involved in cell wall biosynthesis